MAMIAPSAPAQLRAAIYVRVSSKGQEEDGTSLETQEAACRAYALAHGYTVQDADVYREVYTGVELWERPQLTRLRDETRRRAVDVVVAYAIDRLARDPVHLGVVLSEAEHAGVPVEFVTEPLDHTPEGQLIRFVRGYAAKVEHEKIKERTQRGKLARLQAGKPLVGPRAPYGYQWADAGKTSLALDPTTAPILRRIFASALTGASLRTIARTLTAAGTPTPSGAPEWAAQTIASLLANPVYTGQWVALRHRVTKGAQGRKVQRRRPADEHQPIACTVPALVTAAEFAQCAAQLARNKASARRNASDPEATLLRAGLVFCGGCGWAMRVLRNARNGSVVYRCNSAAGKGGAACPAKATITTHQLDADVWQRVEQVLTDETVIAREVARLREADPSTADLDAVERAIADVAKRRQRAAHLVVQLDADAAEPIVRELSVLAAEAQRLEGERAQVLAQQATWQAAQAQLAELTAWCRRVRANLGEFTYAERRTALEALDVRVQVYRTGSPERWAFTARFPFPVSTASTITSGCATSRRRPRGTSGRRACTAWPSAR